MKSASSDGTIQKCLFNPTPQHLPQESLGSLTVRLPRRWGRVVGGGVVDYGMVEISDYYHYACRNHASGFAVAAVFGANTPLFGAIEAAEVVTGFWGASAC